MVSKIIERRNWGKASFFHDIFIIFKLEYNQTKSCKAEIRRTEVKNRERNCRREENSQFLKLLSGNLGMSAGGAFGGNRGVRPVPPEKGVFPLDHMHLCDLEKKEYLNCLKSSGHKSEKCRHLSKMYLQCRMEKNLMAKQDMSELGFGRESGTEAIQDGSEKGRLDN
ncbi:OLC1v1024251C1 [Oldenlandia corymbosa var. corymbosa]|uniref:OLC1v1024251C1 n=1 Tax=Oldenlandia corymbosa var. corymbosa TaxID=529605 RepID=A0AAV1C466_OLDCO|nr:OLC1v1024251C1 [Oldenlandia corymbosa var. corymbosa]